MSSLELLFYMSMAVKIIMYVELIPSTTDSTLKLTVQAFIAILKTSL